MFDTRNLTQALATQYGRVAVGVGTLLTGGAAFGQEAPGKAPSFDAFYKQALSGTSDTDLGRLIDGQLGKVPELQQHASTVGHQVDAAVANFNGAMGKVPWDSYLVTYGALALVALALGAVANVHYGSTLAARALANLHDAKLIEDGRFQKQTLHGLPVWQLKHDKSPREIRGKVIVLLPELTDPTVMGSLPEVLLRHGYEAVMVGSPSVKGQGFKASRTFEKAAALAAPLVVHDLAREAAQKSHRLVLMGYGGQGNRSLFASLGQLTSNEQSQIDQVYAVSPVAHYQRHATIGFQERYLNRPLRLLYGYGYGSEGQPNDTVDTALERAATRFSNQLRGGAIRTPVPVKLVWGKFDQVGHPGSRETIEAGLKGNFTSVEVDTGHLVLFDRGRGARDTIKMIRRDLDLPKVG